jgi:predicted transcriptional regulator of viral defense system
MAGILKTLEQHGGYITVGEARTRGEYEQLRRATADGTLMRIRQGVYAKAEALANNMVDVERIVPRGVLCLYSAFAHYSLSTQVPAAICVAIDAKRKVILPDYPVIDLYYWKKENLEFGIVKKDVAGFKVSITDLERTVCDAVKYRNKIGLDVCGEILDNYLKTPNRNISLLHHYAEKLRVNKILNVYLQTRL